MRRGAAARRKRKKEEERQAAEADEEPEADADIDQAELEELDTDDEAVVSGRDEWVLPEETLSSYRQLYETKLRHMPRDQRTQLAFNTSGEILMALCLDEYPGVILAVLENMASGLEHARMIARYHRKALGLDHVGQRSQFLKDGQVQRALLRNVMTSEPLLRKLLMPKPMIRLYKLNFSKEMTEPATRAARKALRSKYTQGPASECIALIFSTEGRCFQQLAGIPIDEKTVALFCKRTISSSMLVSNMARHAATPPQVIRHLMKQVIVKRNKHLKNLLLKHKNCPGEFKRPGARDSR
jgi:hypothetical protein